MVCFEIKIDFFYFYLFKDTLKLKSYFGNIKLAIFQAGHKFLLNLIVTRAARNNYLDFKLS